MAMTLLPTAYLAPVAWYQCLLTQDEVSLDACEHYQKQTPRNHCLIAMPEGAAKLTIPVSCEAHSPIRDVRISDHGNWRHHHWNALRSAYGKSPFFEFYADDFEPMYTTKREFLWDFNLELMHVIADALDNPRLIPQEAETMHTTEARRLGETSFEPQPHLSSYYQVFAERNGFLSNLSIVDLLFNMGPESILVLNGARSTPNL